MSPTFLYLGNPEELRDGVGDIRNNFEIFKIIDF